MWQEKSIGIRVQDTFGFERTLLKETTDLAIPNRKRVGVILEDGLLPVSSKDIPEIIQLSEQHASEELALMLKLGFGSGLRIGTVCDLKVMTIERAVPNPWIPDWHLLAVGPGAHPSVHTKYGVTGHIWISRSMLEMVRSYIYSTRRLKRQALAQKEHRDLVFLNRFGRPYGTEGSDSSQAINVEMGRLRDAGRKIGLRAIYDFHFHRTRCTFATELASSALTFGSVKIAIGLVKDALLHKDESTTLKYIKFVEQRHVASELSNEFTRYFLGLEKRIAQ